MRLAALALALALLACTDAKGEAAGVVSAVDRFRKAENAQKPELAPAVASAPCTDDEVCAAKTACLAVTEPTAQGLLLKREVERGIADLEQKRLAPDAEAAQALPGKLDRATQLLEQAKNALPGCDAKILGLRAKYHL